MRKKMTHLLPNHRIRIPNGLAVAAALVLLASSVVGYESSQEIQSSDQGIAPTSNVDSSDNDGVNDAAEHKRRGLNLGLLLFRR